MDRAGCFSVLMSVYSKENPQHFNQALDSILNKQTMKPTEFILVCDGILTDELYGVILEYEKQHSNVLKVFKLEENQGLGKALNFGITKCTYDLIARADSDDICAENRFETQIQYMNSHPEVAVVGTDIKEFRDTPKEAVNYKKMPSDFGGVYEMLKSRNPINHMTAMFRKNVVIKVGSYQHLQYAEDYYLWARIIASGYIIENINEPLVLARIGNGMIKRRGSKLHIASWRTLNDYMFANGIITKRIMRKNMVAIRCFVYMPTWIREFVYKYLLRK